MSTLTRGLTTARHGAARLGPITRACIRVASCQRRSRERGQLAALTDRELRDMGLTRGDAAALARRPFWRA